MLDAWIVHTLGSFSGEHREEYRHGDTNPDWDINPGGSDCRDYRTVPTVSLVDSEAQDEYGYGCHKHKNDSRQKKVVFSRQVSPFHPGSFPHS
jgi:hypothetical protein